MHIPTNKAVFPLVRGEKSLSKIFMRGLEMPYAIKYENTIDMTNATIIKSDHCLTPNVKYLFKKKLKMLVKT